MLRSGRGILQAKFGFHADLIIYLLIDLLIYLFIFAFASTFVYVLSQCAYLYILTNKICLSFKLNQSEVESISVITGSSEKVTTPDNVSMFLSA